MAWEFVGYSKQMLFIPKMCYIVSKMMILKAFGWVPTLKLEHSLVIITNRVHRTIHCLIIWPFLTILAVKNYSTFLFLSFRLLQTLLGHVKKSKTRNVPIFFHSILSTKLQRWTFRVFQGAINHFCLSTSTCNLLSFQGHPSMVFLFLSFTSLEGGHAPKTYLLKHRRR